MSISSSARDRKRIAVTRAAEASTTAVPVTLSERSMTSMALIRMFVGYLWFQQLFWKMPPTFAGLYGYIVRESQHTILPWYGALLQHTFLAGCSSLSSPVGCTAFVPLAACVWTAELLVAISLLFGLFTRLGALLATILAVQQSICSLGYRVTSIEWYHYPERDRARISAGILILSIYLSVYREVRYS